MTKTQRKDLNLNRVKDAVQTSFSKAEAIRKLGGDGIGGGWYRLLNQYIKQNSIDTSHFTGAVWNKGKSGGSCPKARIPLDEILVENSSYNNSNNLRKKLVNAGILAYKCCECGCDGNWNGKKITLHLDHKNGNNSDNRIENLQILCPNCHAATSTWCRGQRAAQDTQSKMPSIPTCQCGNIMSKTSKSCQSCQNEIRKADSSQMKFNPSKEQLQEKCEELNWNFCALGRYYSVSDNAVRKRCKKLQVSSVGLEPTNPSF